MFPGGTPTAKRPRARISGTSAAVVNADELAPPRFLLDAPDVAQVRAIVREQLGPPIEHDDDAHSDLMATLRAFIRADGNVAAAAEACFVHKNTLRYRLQRLTEILDRDPAQPDA